MRFHTISALLLVLLVVAAGCSGLVVDDEQSTETSMTPSTQPRSTDTTTNQTIDNLPDVPTFGEPLPVDEDRIFQQVRSLLDVKLHVPQATVKNTTRVKSYYEFPRYSRLLGITYPDSISVERDVIASTQNGRAISMGLDENASEELIARTLAHEYVHISQYQNGIIGGEVESPTLPLTDRREMDGFLTRRAILEGTATYTADIYAERYLSEDSPTTVRSEENYSALPAWLRWSHAPYVFGNRYVHSRIDSPRNVTAIYENPPQTTEQILHPGSADEPVELNPNTVINTSEVNVTDSYRMGELYTRLVLSTELDYKRAASAASGWGNDSLLTLERDGNERYAWVLRWDDEANATQFETALRDYLNSTAQQRGSFWQSSSAHFSVERADNRTVVLYFGSDQFISKSD